MAIDSGPTTEVRLRTVSNDSMCCVEYMVGVNVRHLRIPRSLAEEAIARGYAFTIID